MSLAVVVASFGRPDRLEACVNGLMEQTQAPEEVIAVVRADDGPTRQTAARLTAEWPVVRAAVVDRPGSVAAYNLGLARATSEFVAYVDDDAVPRPDWAQRILATFASDARIAAVGGRDVVFEEGRTIEAPPGRAPERISVGRLMWFGRMSANHHIGGGPPRDVEILKGANMAFRRAEVTRHGFDERLRGRGAQVHAELSVCLPLVRAGRRIVYDPAIIVDHRPAPRPAGDHRRGFDAVLVSDSAHNEALQILDHISRPRRAAYAAWSLAAGSSEAPGAVALARDLVRRRPAALRRTFAAQRGRLAAWRTHRQVPRAPI